MKNRVYYGEYSLQHWKDLILSQNIQIPSYQRTFVWNEEDIYKLYQSFKNHYYIPPVTIGAFNKGKNNYILDGQQRLTSLILLLVGSYPNKDAFKSSELEYAGSDEETTSSISYWSLKELINSQNNTIEKIKATIYSDLNKDKYKRLKNYNLIQIDEDFLKTTYLGFSYIVPDIDATENEQTKFYSEVFRRINNSGIHLSKLESRRALYFLSPKKQNFFDPDFIREFYVSKPNGKSCLDFVRYLAIITNYKKINTYDTLAATSNIEDFYEEYIFSTVNNEENEKFSKFTTLFPNGKFSDRIELLESTINAMNLSKDYKSIIHMDLVFFGLINKVFFDFQPIEETKYDEIKSNIEDAFETRKTKQMKNSGNVSYIRDRFKTSLKIYEGSYVHGE